MFSVIIMAADALATQGARTLAAMVLTQLAQSIPITAPVVSRKASLHTCKPFSGLQATVLEEMPPFPERESSILAKLKKKKPHNAEQKEIEPRPVPAVSTTATVNNSTEPGHLISPQVQGWLICPEGHVSSLNKCNPIQFITCTAWTWQGDGHWVVKKTHEIMMGKNFLKVVVRRMEVTGSFQLIKREFHLK